MRPGGLLLLDLPTTTVVRHWKDYNASLQNCFVAGLAGCRYRSLCLGEINFSSIVISKDSWTKESDVKGRRSKNPTGYHFRDQLFLFGQSFRFFNRLCSSWRWIGRGRLTKTSQKNCKKKNNYSTLTWTCRGDLFRFGDFSFGDLFFGDTGRPSVLPSVNWFVLKKITKKTTEPPERFSFGTSMRAVVDDVRRMWLLLVSSATNVCTIK